MKTPFHILFFIAGIFSFGKISAQEVLVPLTVNPVQQADAIRLTNQRSAAAAPTDTLIITPLGLRDKFEYESHRPDTALWETDPVFFSNAVGSGVFINRSWAKSPINIGVCTFDGLQWNGEPYLHTASSTSTGRCDELFSRPIDLTKEKTGPTTFNILSVGDSVYLSFWYQPGGFGYMPNAQDSFLLDFNIPAWNPDPFTPVWKNVWFKEGYNAGSDSSFHHVMIKLDSASYFTSGFRFRFHNYASQCGSNDHWHLDDVYLKSGRTMGDTIVKEASFVYEMPSFLKDFRAMPASHYKPAVNMTDTVSIFIRDNDTLSTGRAITYRYDVLDETGASIGNYQAAGTALTYDSIGYCNWSTIERPGVYPGNFSGFPTFATNDTGFYVIRHKLIDGARVDSVDCRQPFFNYYAYDDGTAEVGYGLLGQYSQLAYKFTMPPAIDDTLVGVQMYFLPVFGIDDLMLREFTLKVWADGGNQPGTLLYSQDSLHPSYNFETPDRFVTYPINDAVIHLSPSQTYYIGWEQQAIDRLYIGFDFNTDHSDKIYYNTSGNWNQSIFDGSLMMRPVFGERYPIGQDETGIAEQNNAAFSIYPNPANDHFTIHGNSSDFSGMEIGIFDIAGREVMTIGNVQNGQQIGVSGLSAGVYYVRAKTAENGIAGGQRLLISK